MGFSVCKHCCVFLLYYLYPTVVFLKRISKIPKSPSTSQSWVFPPSKAPWNLLQNPCILRGDFGPSRFCPDLHLKHFCGRWSPNSTEALPLPQCHFHLRPCGLSPRAPRLCSLCAHVLSLPYLVQLQLLFKHQKLKRGLAMSRFLKMSPNVRGKHFQECPQLPVSTLEGKRRKQAYKADVLSGCPSGIEAVWWGRNISNSPPNQTVREQNS